MKSRARPASGFTLIEMAVVLAIIGLVTAGLVALFTGVLKATKSRVAADNAVLVQQALQRFIERSGRLPCPSLPATFTGIEDTATTSVGTSCTATAALGVASSMARGVLPWKTLGLPLEQVQDGYGRMFTYNVSVAATLTTLTTNTIGGVMGSMTVHTASPIGLGLPIVAGRNQINSCWTGPAAPAATENSCNLKALVVLVSHGENGFGGVTSQGGTVPASTDASEIENTDANLAFVKSDPTSTGFDDLVFAWSPEDLLEPLARRSTVRTAAAATQEMLRSAAVQISNAIVNSASACSPTPCTNTATIPVQPAAPPPAQTIVAGVSIVMPNDGWGSPVAYSTTVGGSNLCTLAAGTVAFTLTSWGPDQTTFGLNTVNPNTNIYDDLVLIVTVDQMRNQVITRFGSC